MVIFTLKDLNGVREIAQFSAMLPVKHKDQSLTPRTHTNTAVCIWCPSTGGAHTWKFLMLLGLLT